MPAAIAIPAIIAGASAIGGTATQLYSANKAQKAQEKAGTDALTFQREVLGQQQRNQQPYMTVGNMSLRRLNTMLSNPGDPNIPMVGGDGQPMGDILVVAPNGQQMVRPASERAHWQGLGATVQDSGMRQGNRSGAVPRIPPPQPQPVPGRSLASMQQGVR